MNTKIKTTTVPVETTFDGILLKGELGYWAKDYCVKLIEPFEGHCGAHLQYGVSVKYVLQKSEKPNCHEIDLLEKSKNILISIYLKNLNKNGVENYE